MMNLLKVLVLILTSLMTITLSSGAFAGDKYKGTWSDNGGHSTLEIRSETPLIIKYCRNDRCSLKEPKGSIKSMKIEYPQNGDFRGATLKFKKSGEGYKGTYKIKGAKGTYQIVMSK